MPLPSCPFFSGYYCCGGLLLAQIGPNLNKMDTAQQQSDGLPFKPLICSAADRNDRLSARPPAASSHLVGRRKVNKESSPCLGCWAPQKRRNLAPDPPVAASGNSSFAAAYRTAANIYTEHCQWIALGSTPAHPSRIPRSFQCQQTRKLDAFGLFFE